MTASSAFSFTCASTPAVNLPQLLPNAPQRLQPDIFLAGMARVSPPFCVGELTHASRRDCLPSVAEPERGPFTQAAKGTAAQGGGVFCLSPVGRSGCPPTLLVTLDFQSCPQAWGSFRGSLKTWSFLCSRTKVNPPVLFKTIPHLDH